MSLRPPLALTVCLLVGLSACGRSSGGHAPASASRPISAAELVEPTPDQAKAMVAALPPPFNAGDPAAGKAVFARCRSCHSAEPGGGDLIGPSLWGVYGRAAGSRPGYAYSDALRGAGFSWDAPHLDQWLTDPRAYRPGTKMSFVGLRDTKDRQDVIAYLRTAGPPPKP